MKKVFVLMMTMSLGVLMACGKAEAPKVEKQPVEVAETEEKVTTPKVEVTKPPVVEEPKEEVEEETIEEETEDAEEVETEEAEEVKEEPAEEKKESDNSNEIRPEFKAAMDEYEKFYDDYCAFMKKYNGSSDPMDAINMLGDYTKMLQQMEEMDKKFEAWNSKDMTNAELAYYVDVTARIQKKLLEVNN